MKKVAVFGKPANGKSALSKQLASATGIELYALDSILYQPDGQEIDRERYEEIHHDIVSSESWIIEGLGPLNSIASFNQRLETADTLIYIDLPYPVTYWLVAKRCIKGLFKKPEGWPEGCSVLKGSLQSYKVLQFCPQFWNQTFLQRLKKLEAESQGKRLYVIQSLSDLNRFVEKHVKVIM